jgi:hypothetical protein
MPRVLYQSPPYPDPERPGVYRVPLGSYSPISREAIIDAESLPLIAGGTCQMSSTREGINFVSVFINGEHVPLRRVIMGITCTEMQVGHINGDPLDCRRENLVVRTVAERNQAKRKTTEVAGRPTSSRFKGVFFDAQTGKWRARMRANGRYYELGRHYSEVQAAMAYDDAARKYCGEHAWLNFPKPGSGERGGAIELAQASESQEQLRAAA